jgi:hypothetical protein
MTLDKHAHIGEPQTLVLEKAIALVEVTPCTL